jgi:hypothetical protein
VLLQARRLLLVAHKDDIPAQSAAQSAGERSSVAEPLENVVLIFRSVSIYNGGVSPQINTMHTI